MPFQPSKSARDRQSSGASAVLAAARAYVFDLDGCLVLGEQPGGEEGVPVPGVRELLHELRRRDTPFVCCTNASGRPPAAYAADLRRLGLPVEDDAVVTPAVVAAAHLARDRPGATAMALGGDGVLEPLRHAGVDVVAPSIGARADVVLVGAARAVTAVALQSAADAIWAGAELLVTSFVPAMPSRGGPRASVSAAVAAGLAHVTGAEPRVVGKPSPLAAEHLAARLGGRPDEVVVVGDDPALDIALGRRMGATTVLVLSGMATPEAAAQLPAEERPDAILAGAEELFELLRSGPAPV